MCTHRKAGVESWVLLPISTREANLSSSFIWELRDRKRIMKQEKWIWVQWRGAHTLICMNYRASYSTPYFLFSLSSFHSIIRFAWPNIDLCLFVCFLSSLHLVHECTNKFLIWTWESRSMLYFSIMSGAMKKVQSGYHKKVATFTLVSIIHCQLIPLVSACQIFFSGLPIFDCNFPSRAQPKIGNIFPSGKHCGTTITRHGPAILALSSIVF